MSQEILRLVEMLCGKKIFSQRNPGNYTQTPRGGVHGHGCKNEVVIEQYCITLRR